MSLLSDADLDQMRGVLDQSLPETAVRQTRSASDNAGGGGGTATWTSAGTVVARRASMGGDERLIAGRLAEDADWMITLPAETTIERDDRLVISGTTYNVVAIRAPRSFELSRRCECAEVT